MPFTGKTKTVDTAHIRVKRVRQRLGGAAEEGKALPGRVSVLGLLAAAAHYSHCTFPLKSKTTTPPALRPSLRAARPRPPIPRGKNASPHPLDPPLPHMTCPRQANGNRPKGENGGGMIRCIRSPLAERGLFEPRTKANQYLLDPLTAPEPSQEDGPGSTFVNPDPLLRTFSRRNKDSTANKNETPLPTPPTSASPTRVSFQPPSNNSVSRSTSTRNHTGSRSHPPRPEKHTRSISTPVAGFHRPQSISQRYPGDMSHRPLDVIKREQRAADRSPHLRTRRHGPN
ncbi:hypothetical protein BN1708_006232, partial [Verticillium longisporum]